MFILCRRQSLLTLTFTQFLSLVQRPWLMGGADYFPPKTVCFTVSIAFCKCGYKRRELLILAVSVHFSKFFRGLCVLFALSVAFQRGQLSPSSHSIFSSFFSSPRSLGNRVGSAGRDFRRSFLRARTFLHLECVRCCSTLLIPNGRRFVTRQPVAWT